jgi:hypothetical protein
VKTIGVAILMVVGIAASGCGGAMQQAAPVAAHSTVTTASAFTIRHATQAAGGPVIGAGRTAVSLRPLPGGTFGLLLVFKNLTHRQLMLDDVQAVVPHGSFVRQLGTHLAPFFQCKPYCSRHMVMKGPFGVEHAQALHVHPLRSAQAQLDFAVAACGALKTASAKPITQAILTYRDTRGMTFHQTVPLQSSQLQLEHAGQIACKA